jgi:hypothetical protein
MLIHPGVKIETHGVHYKVILSAFDRMKIIHTENDPSSLILWWEGLMQHEDFLMVYPHQRVNKIPGIEILCSKTSFFQSLSRMKQHFPIFYNFFPITYQLPSQFSEFQREHVRLCVELSRQTPTFVSASGGITWIMKPSNGCCGNGIHLIQNSFQVATQMQHSVIQRYVSPYLVNGYKFDFRFYVLITTLDPLTIYLYNEGLARFCSHFYHPPTRDNLKDRYCHLTNTAVNMTNLEHQESILEFASVVLRRIVVNDPRGVNLWQRIRQIVLLSILSQYQNMLQNVGEVTAEGKRKPAPQKGWKLPRKPIQDLRRYFQLLGIDVMLNDQCDPMVLELNDRPSMSVTYEMEEELKTRIVYEALKVITVDGGELEEGMELGGWERLLPRENNSMLGKIVKEILEIAHKGQQMTVERNITRRLGYVPSNGYGKSPISHSLSNLPSLH